jgi:hypothetical protein
VRGVVGRKRKELDEGSGLPASVSNHTELLVVPLSLPLGLPPSDFAQAKSLLYLVIPIYPSRLRCHLLQEVLFTPHTSLSPLLRISTWAQGHHMVWSLHPLVLAVLEDVVTVFILNPQCLPR